MFLVKRLGLLILLTGILCGCSETEDVVLPEVTVAFVAYEGADSAKFLLTAEPLTTELTVLVEFVSTAQAPFRRWEVIRKGTVEKTFTVPLDTSVSWEVSILRFEEATTKDYPISGLGLSTDNSFSGYVLGSPSSITTIPLVESISEFVNNSGGWMYWINDWENKIQRANLDGSNRQELVTGRLLSHIALDVAGGKIYWTEEDSIRCANLDGSNRQNILTTSSWPDAIALDVVGGKIYWTEGDSIRCANLDGSNRQNIFTASSWLEHPRAIALDVAGGKIYWIERNTIRRANLDGSNRQNIFTGLWWPDAIALDITGGKIYWIERDTIRCANLNGSNRQNIFTASSWPERPRAIALDVAGGKIYWTVSQTQRVNLGGSNREEIVLVNKIQRADFNGSNVQDILTRTVRVEPNELSVRHGEDNSSIVLYID